MQFSVGLANLESTLLDACSSEREWPAQIAAAVYAGVDYAIANPEVGQILASARGGHGGSRSYESLITRFTGLLQVKAPKPRLPGSTDEALVAGIFGLVGDHLRLHRLDRLAQLRPDLVLLTLLPYLGFAEAQCWANRSRWLASS